MNFVTFQIREARHENLIPFIGAIVDHNHVAILTAYCARGSLEDVLANEDLHLDNMFVSSLVADILKVIAILQFQNRIFKYFFFFSGNDIFT